jgi:transposase
MDAITWSISMRRISIRRSTSQKVDLGYGWGERGTRFPVGSSSPGLAAKVSFHGLYLYNEGQVRIWPYARAHGEHTIEVLRRLRAEIPSGKLVVLRGGAPYHRAKVVWSAAASLNITLMPPAGYSADLMAVEPLWRWLREDVTYQHCHATAKDLIRRVAAFEADVNADPCAVANRLWVKDRLDPEKEKLRFSKQTGSNRRNPLGRSSHTVCSRSAPTQAFQKAPLRDSEPTYA